MSTVAEFMGKIAAGVEKKGEEALAIAEIYQFNITGDQAATWSINCKDGPSCNEGPNDDATCIITIADEDFVALMSGEKNGMELFATESSWSSATPWRR